MTTYLVTIQDKSLCGEPDIALAIVEAVDEVEACAAADDTINKLAYQGRGRCVPHARTIDLGRFYRLGALVRLPVLDRAVEACRTDVECETCHAPIDTSCDCANSFKKEDSP